MKKVFNFWSQSKKKRSRKYPKYQEDMITSNTNPKDIKNIKKKDFQNYAKVHYNNYKKGVKPSSREEHRSPLLGVSFTPFISPLLSYQFLYLIHCKALNGHEWLNPQLGPCRPKSQVMYDVLTIYQCKGVFYSIIFSSFILHYSSIRGQTLGRG